MDWIDDAKHKILKAWSTARIITVLACARTFGEYEHSGWNGDFEYARYKWRGKSWIIPTGPVTQC